MMGERQADAVSRAVQRRGRRFLHRCVSAAEAIDGRQPRPAASGRRLLRRHLDAASSARSERAAALPRPPADTRDRPGATVGGDDPVYDVVRGGKPLVIPIVGDEILRRIAVDEAHLESLRACGPKALLSVPLRDGGEPLGVVTLASKSRAGSTTSTCASSASWRAASAPSSSTWCCRRSSPPSRRPAPKTRIALRPLEATIFVRSSA